MKTAYWRGALLLLVVGGVAALLSRPLHAEHQVEAHAQIPAEEAARNFMAVMRVEEQLVPVMKQLVQMQAAQAQNMGVPVDVDILNRWIDENVRWSDFEPGLIEIYTEVFTPEELEELSAFYRSPTGQKSIEMMPVLMERGGRLGMEIMDKKTPALIKLFEEQEKNAG